MGLINIFFGPLGIEPGAARSRSKYADHRAMLLRLIGIRFTAKCFAGFLFLEPNPRPSPTSSRPRLLRLRPSCRSEKVFPARKMTKFCFAPGFNDSRLPVESMRTPPIQIVGTHHQRRSVHRGTMRKEILSPISEALIDSLPDSLAK